MSKSKIQSPDINFREAFRDIAFGYSSFLFDNQLIYIKHLSVFDQIYVEKIKQELIDKAIVMGLPTEKEALAYIADNNIWTSNDESKLEQQKKYINNLRDTRKNLYRVSEINSVDNDIDKANQEYNMMSYKKRELMGQTAEKYAEKRVSEHYILCSFYKDQKLNNPFFNQEEVDLLEAEDLTYVISQYNDKFLCFDDNNIQKVTLQDFFQMYMPFCEDVRNFYNKPLFELSINQVKLIVYSRMFKNIFENYPKIPDGIKRDPEKIIDYVNSQEKAKDVLKNLDKDGASTIVGAKTEDYDHLGYKETQGKSLSSMLKEKGGKMDMKDLMNAMNT